MSPTIIRKKTPKDFCQISRNPILRCKFRTINSFCIHKVSLYWFRVKFLWLKDVFLHEKKLNLKSNVFTLTTDKKTYFYMESILYPYVNILEGPGSYFSLSMNDYTDVLYFIENNGLAHLQNIFFLFLLLYVECSHFLP